MKATNKTGKTINFCKVPGTISGLEAKVYQKLLSFHCSHTESEQPDHKCCGQITFNRKSVTMNCKKCGDARTNLSSIKEESGS